MLNTQIVVSDLSLLYQYVSGKIVGNIIHELTTLRKRIRFLLVISEFPKPSFALAGKHQLLVYAYDCSYNKALTIRSWHLHLYVV